jgi:uncharacterized damage-inducible protein DinB
MIQSTSAFIHYFDGIRRRTLTFARIIPAGQLDWSPAAGEFTCADIVRHLTAAESLFVGAVVEGRWHYRGHNRSPDDTLDSLLAGLEAGHVAAMALLGTLPDTALPEARPTLDGPPVKAWRLLMAMVEHEVHHRSQLAVYLALLGVTPPHIYGLGVEDVIARATG